MSAAGSITGLIRNRFISGLLIIVPLVISYQVIIFLFTKLDNILNPIVSKYTGYQIPGLGIAVTVLVILLVGLVAHSVIGGRLFRAWESFLARVPVVRTVYSPAKQLLEAFTASSETSFKRVALVQYPRKGVWVIGFLSQDVDLRSGEIEGEFMAVFIPSTPTPFTGFMAMIPKSDIRQIDMSVEEAVKFLVSAGVALPRAFLNDIGAVQREDQ
jgi:uncharacterized membrane protein